MINVDKLNECEVTIKNIGWTLGNECPYRCKHCYSMSSREKGKDLSKDIVDKVVEQISRLKVETVNVGGNEPLFTNGLDPKKTLLPYIINKLNEKKIAVGLTTSGITALYLYKHFREEFLLLNDIDISFDSPFEKEHNENRRANIYRQAMETLKICKYLKKDHTIVMCAMNWNFTRKHIASLVSLAKEYDANVRINVIKPTEKSHLDKMLSFDQYYSGFEYLNTICNALDMTDPILSGVANRMDSKRCPCGRTSFRIHSITPEGEIPVSPCVYLHDFKVGNLLTDNIEDIIYSKEFSLFRKRNANPKVIEDCASCDKLYTCGGGCAAMSYLYNYLAKGERNLFLKDPYCAKNRKEKKIKSTFVEEKEKRLVHMDYLCTWIGKPL